MTDWNHWELFIGPPGCGKSTAMMKRAHELSRTPAYCFAHDPGWRLPDKLLDGTPIRLRRFTSYGQAAAELARDPHGVFCFSDLDTERFMVWCMKMAELNRAARRPPMVVCFDEMVVVRQTSPSYLAPAAAELLTRRRHYRIAVLGTVQSPTMVARPVRTLGTRLYIYRPGDQTELDAYERMMVKHPPERLATLGKHQYVVHDIA